MKILAVVGSLRKDSFNRQLALSAQEILTEQHPDVAFEILDWSRVPLFNQDDEFPTPEAVFEAREAVKAADGVWLFAPEYNHSIPGPLKNLFDWLSRPQGEGMGQVFRGKPFAISGVSPGMGATLQAQDDVVVMLSFLRADIMNAPRLSIPNIENQTEGGKLKLTDSAPYLKKQADAFVAFIDARQDTSA